MTTAFISDLHLTPERPASTELFENFINNAPNYLSTLYILGDLFEYWVGDDGAGSLGHRPIEEALKRTVDAGTAVYFLHGNRDFLVGDDFARRTGCQLLPDPVVINTDDVKLLLTHGDGLCTDDIVHQKARGEMLSSKWKLAFLGQSLDQRIATADKMRQKSEMDKQGKSAHIMDVNQQAVEKIMRDHGVQMLIHGHTHKPAAHEFMLDGKLARRYVLGDWYEQKSAIFLENGKLTLRR